VIPSQPHQVIAAVAGLPGEFNVDPRTTSVKLATLATPQTILQHEKYGNIKV